MDALKSQHVLQELIGRLRADQWWLLCQTDLGEDGLTKIFHRPLTKINALGQSCFSSLQKKKWGLFWADCANLPACQLWQKGQHKIVWSRCLVLDTTDHVQAEMSVIPLPRLMCLYDELTMSCYWCSANAQSSWLQVKTATKQLNLAPIQGLAWYNVVRLDNKPVFDPSPRTHMYSVPL